MCQLGGPKPVNLGRVRDSPQWSQGLTILKYVDGDLCPDQIRKKSTTIRFTCSESHVVSNPTVSTQRVLPESAGLTSHVLGVRGEALRATRPNGAQAVRPRASGPGCLPWHSASRVRGFPGGLVVEYLPAVWKLQVQSQDCPLEEGMATHSSILARRITWTEEPGGLQSVGSQRVR